jgi:hypothetical protein
VAPQPTPTASPVANEVDCAAPADSGILAGYGPTTIHDETGLVEWCETVAPTLPPGISSVFNPDGDRRLLQVHWGSTLCDARADFYLRTASGAPGYTFQGTTYDGPCRLALVTHEVRLHLSGEINASDLTSWWTRVGDSSSSESTAADCSETFLLLDRTGLVESCSEWTPAPGQSGVSQGPDASSVFVAWTYSYCRGAPFARFERDGDRYVFELGHLGTLPVTPPSCEPVTRTVGIAVRFQQPLDVGLIDAVSKP